MIHAVIYPCCVYLFCYYITFIFFRATYSVICFLMMSVHFLIQWLIVGTLHFFAPPDDVLLHFPCPRLPPPLHRNPTLPASFLRVDLIFIWPFYRSSLNKATQRVYGKRTAQHHNRLPHASKLSLSKLVFTKLANFTGTSLENLSLFRTASSRGCGPKEGDSKFKPTKR